MAKNSLPEQFTVIGASGFIGRHVVAHLQDRGSSLFLPDRSDPAVYTRPLGHVIYAAGLSADFRVRPFDTMDGHITNVVQILKNADFESFLLLSSTRVYHGAPSTEEDAILHVAPTRPDHLYNISKIAGEAICLRLPRAGIRVVRMSNVFGDDFESGMQMSDVLRAALKQGNVQFTSSLQSAKDYIWVGDVARMLVAIAIGGRERLYNLASGMNLSNGALGDLLAELTGCSVQVVPDAPTIIYPDVSIRRLKRDFAFEPEPIRAVLARLIPLYREVMA